TTREVRRVVGEAVVGIMEKSARRFSSHALAAVRVAGEQALQVDLAYLLVMALERLPRRTRHQRRQRRRFETRLHVVIPWSVRMLRARSPKESTTEILPRTRCCCRRRDSGPATF